MLHAGAASLRGRRPAFSGPPRGCCTGCSCCMGSTSVEHLGGKQRSFQLLDQGRVIRAIEGVTESTTVDFITEREAREIKPHLALVVLCSR